MHPLAVSAFCWCCASGEREVRWPVCDGLEVERESFGRCSFLSLVSTFLISAALNYFSWPLRGK